MQHAPCASKRDQLRLDIISFGFKYGLPVEAEWVMDVRFFPNPYFVPDLKLLDGKDERVQTFVTNWPEAPLFLDKYISLLEYLIPLYLQTGKGHLVIGVGCTGGRHRSVAIAEEIRRRLNGPNRRIHLSHRDIELG
jgi:UPF0042 nucleotide-binding protein